MLDLHLAGLDMAPVATAAQPALALESDPATYASSISGENIPVRKTFLDWILFRSVASVRHRMFGEDLSQAIPAEVKAKRLTDSTRAAIDDLAEGVRNELFPKVPQEYSERLINGYVTQFVQEMQNALRRRKAELEQERAKLQLPFEANVQILAALDTMRDAATEAINGLERLAEEERALGHTITSLKKEAATSTDALPAPSDSKTGAASGELSSASVQTAQPTGH
jgi:hypothetical protein